MAKFRIRLFWLRKSEGFKLLNSQTNKTDPYIGRLGDIYEDGEWQLHLAWLVITRYHNSEF